MWQNSKTVGAGKRCISSLFEALGLLLRDLTGERAGVPWMNQATHFERYLFVNTTCTRRHSASRSTNQIHQGSSVSAACWNHDPTAGRKLRRLTSWSLLTRRPCQGGDPAGLFHSFSGNFGGGRASALATSPCSEGLISHYVLCRFYNAWHVHRGNRVFKTSWSDIMICLYVLRLLRSTLLLDKVSRCLIWTWSYGRSDLENLHNLLKFCFPQIATERHRRARSTTMSA